MRVYLCVFMCVSGGVGGRGGGVGVVYVGDWGSLFTALRSLKQQKLTEFEH